MKPLHDAPPKVAVGHSRKASTRWTGRASSLTIHRSGHVGEARSAPTGKKARKTPAQRSGRFLQQRSAGTCGCGSGTEALRMQRAHASKGPAYSLGCGAGGQLPRITQIPFSWMSCLLAAVTKYKASERFLTQPPSAGQPSPSDRLPSQTNTTKLPQWRNEACLLPQIVRRVSGDSKKLLWRWAIARDCDQKGGKSWRTIGNGGNPKNGFCSVYRHTRCTCELVQMVWC